MNVSVVLKQCLVKVCSLLDSKLLLLEVTAVLGSAVLPHGEGNSTYKT